MKLFKKLGKKIALNGLKKRTKKNISYSRHLSNGTWVTNDLKDEEIPVIEEYSSCELGKLIKLTYANVDHYVVEVDGKLYLHRVDGPAIEYTGGNFSERSHSYYILGQHWPKTPKEFYIHMYEQGFMSKEEAFLKLI
jgi:hypothetical protein